LELTGVNSKPRRVREDDVSEGSTEYHGKFAAPHSSYEGEVTRLELERQLSVSLAAQTERDQRIARLTALLEQAEADAAKRAGLELREHADRLLMQTSLVEQRDAELVDMQAKLRDMQAKLDELLLSRDQEIGQYEKKFANVRAKLKTNESELEAVQLRLTDAEKDLAKSKAEADTLRAQTATSSVNRDEDQVTRRLMERMRAIEAEVASKRWNEKSIAEMECRNEG
jgi:chromosome segregation ATPase